LAFTEVSESGFEADDLFKRLKELLFSETLPAEDSKSGDIEYVIHRCC